MDSNVDSEVKKRKLCNSEAENLTTLSRFSTFENFKFKQVLSDNTDSKGVFLEASLKDESSVVLLEKLHFNKNSVDKLLNSEVTFHLQAEDDGFQSYECHPCVNNGEMKAVVIYPATKMHIEKYMFQPMYVVDETAQVYKDTVLPHLLEQKFSIQWVYNILEHKSESERITFEDPDPDLGFILLPDMKWDESQLDNVYVIAICNARNIKSLRDLTVDHIPLLKNVRTKGLEAIAKTYNIPCNKLRVYIHYQPSYYHLHIHFNGLHSSMPGTQFEKAHLLDTVIGNIELCPAYYQSATLTYSIKQNDSLFQKLRDAGVVKL